MNDLQQPIAVGRTAEIYAWGGDQVLKLFFPTVPQLWIDKEIDTGRYIAATQLPVPQVYETVEVDSRQGVVYERIEGPSLLHRLATRPWRVIGYARLLARLHAQVHQVSAPAGLETQREWATGGIPDSTKLPGSLKDQVLQLLETMPAGNQLCHGDFHPGNIIVTRRGPVIIDWMTASRGVGCGDLARTSVLLEAARTPEGTPMRWLLEFVRQLLLGTYLKAYFRLQPVDGRSLTAWRAIMAANFFIDVSLPEEEETMIAIVEQGIRAMADG